MPNPLRIIKYGDSVTIGTISPFCIVAVGLPFTNDKRIGPFEMDWGAITKLSALSSFKNTEEAPSTSPSIGPSEIISVTAIS